MLYYFIGIKGSGMSSLAQIMHELGYNVTGSDKPDHFFTEVGLVEKGIKFYEFNPDNIKEEMIIVKGNAFNDEFSEVKKAKELNLKIYTYQEMIDEITKETKLIAVSGCHGKTTTTTMVSKLFENLGVNYLIGDGTGHAIKGNEYFPEVMRNIGSCQTPLLNHQVAVADGVKFIPAGKLLQRFFPLSFNQGLTQ